MRAALQQELDAEALPLDDRPVQRRHVELVVAVRVGPGRDQVGDVEQLGVAHEHSFLQLSLQRRDLLRLAVDTRPVHLVERPSGRAHGARSEARAHAHAPQRREASGAPPPLRKRVCCQFLPPPAAPRARAVTRTPRLTTLPRVGFHGSLLLKSPVPDLFSYYTSPAHPLEGEPGSGPHATRATHLVRSACWRAGERGGAALGAPPGMRAWRGSAILMRTRAALLLLAAAGAGAAADGASAAARVLAESDFAWDMDGWSVEGDGVRDVAHMSKMIKAGDNGADAWFFVAPHKFTGSKREAYGGHLSFRHGFFEFNRSAPPSARSAAVLDRPRLHAACGPACRPPGGAGPATPPAVRESGAERGLRARAPASQRGHALVLTRCGCEQRRQRHAARLRRSHHLGRARPHDWPAGPVSRVVLQQRPQARAAGVGWVARHRHQPASQVTLRHQKPDALAASLCF